MDLSLFDTASPCAGGTWHQRPPGIWPKAEGADIYTHAYDKVTKVKTNPTLHNAGLGNWYIGE